MATAESALRFNLFAKDQTGAGIRSAESNFGKLGKGLVTKFAAAAGAIGGISLLGSFLDEARESAKVSRLTENAIKATGGAAKISADQVGALATSLSNKTAIDDEAIQSGQNLLLTFKNIRNETGKGNDIFNQASAAALDMTAAMNNGSVTAENLKGTSVQLGKALNDPIKGITALTRSGVTFTEAQKKQIKSLVASGKTMEAQKMILAELKSEFGGAAEAAADPAQKAQVAWGNLQEQLGTQLLPVFNKVMGFLSDKAIPAVSRLVENIQSGDGVFAKFRAGLRAVGEFVSTQIVPVLQRFGEWFTTTGWPAIQRFARGLWTALQPAIAQIGKSFREDIQPALQNLITKFKEAWPTIQRFGTIVLQIAGFILTKVVPVLIKFYSKYLAAVIRVFGQVFSAGWKVIGFLIDLGKKVGEAGAAFGRFVGKIGGAMADAYGAVRSGISKAVGFIKGLPGDAVAAVGNLGSKLADAGKQLIQGFINGIKDKFNDVKNTLGDLTGKLTSWKGPASKDKVLLRPIGRLIIDGLVKGFEDKNPEVKSSLEKLTDRIKKKFDTAREFAKGLREQFRGLADVSGLDTTVTDPLGNSREGGLGELLRQERERVANAQQFAKTYEQLRKMGLNSATLTGLRDAGPEGGLKAAQQILSGGQAAVAEFNQLSSSLAKVGTDFAAKEAKAVYGFDPNAKVMARIGAGKQTINLVIDPSRSGDKMTRAVVEGLREWVRVNGKGDVQVAFGVKKK